MTSTQQVTPTGRRNRRIERDSWVPTLGPGMVLGAISTIGLVISMLMSWRTPDVHPSGIPLAFLFDDAGRVGRLEFHLDQAEALRVAGVEPGPA